MSRRDGQSNARPKKRRVHKTTLLFVLVFVVLPWTLISIPGDSIAGGGTTGLNVSDCQHGWPFIHMHSTHYDLNGNWVNKTFVRGKPANVDTKPLAIKWFNNFFHAPERDLKWIEYDLRLSKSEWSEIGYWSNTKNWSVWDDEHHFEIRWLGLLANLLLVAVVAVMAGWPIEKKIRNGKLFKFSLFSFGVVVALLCVALTFGVQTYRDVHSEQTYVQNLQQLNKEDLLWLNVEHSDRFPRLISQLFNGGRTPWGDLQFFRKVVDASIEIHIDALDEKQMESVLKVLDQGDFGLEVDASEYNEHIEQHLQKLDKYRIVSLNLCYDAYDWFEERTGEEFYDMPREEALKKSAIKVNLDLQLLHLKNLSVELTEFFTSREQLEPFLGLSSRTNVLVLSVDEDGSKFILETHESWPDESDFEWRDTLPATLEKAKKRFPGPVELKED